MTRFNRVLCPVDMSKNSLAAIELATDIAKQRKAALVFMYVAPTWVQEDSNRGDEVASEDLKAFHQLKPLDDSVKCEHLFLHGNAGPEIVRESAYCDVIVIGSQGHTGFARLLLGSVTQYVMRNAKCLVVTAKNSIPNEENLVRKVEFEKRYVTEAMHQVAPLNGHDQIEDVILDLEHANETAAPVVNGQNEVVGILTQTDIDHYYSLRQRLAAKDPSVVPEVFDVNDFGNYRVDYNEFEQVKRHMSSPVTTIQYTQHTDEALDIFAANEAIHHLVVIGDKGQPLGILQPKHCSSFHQIRQSNESKGDAKTT